jgi:hypothetical protein
VLYALRYPFSFAVLASAFVLGLCARGIAQRLVFGQRRPAWAKRLTRRAGLLWLKPYVDPYGCLAAAIGGPAWGPPVEVPAARGRPTSRAVGQLLAGPVALCAMGFAALAAFRGWTGLVLSGSGIVKDVYHGELLVAFPSHFKYELGYGQVALLLAGVVWLTMGILAIMPLPPLDGGKLLLAIVPKTLGWQKARFRLDDENWGVLILLILALPVLVRTPLLITFLGRIVDPLIGVVS